MADLKTDYKDDVLDTTQNTKRKYQMIDNGDGTVSFEDVTEYLQQGDSFGANDVNGITRTINNLDICETYTSGASSIETSIDSYIAQANMRDKSNRKVVFVNTNMDWIVDITRDGNNYSGTAIKTLSSDNYRFSFIKIGSSATTVAPIQLIKTVELDNTSSGIITTNIDISKIISAVALNWARGKCIISRHTGSTNGVIYVQDAVNSSAVTNTNVKVQVNYI